MSDEKRLESSPEPSAAKEESKELQADGVEDTNTKAPGESSGAVPAEVAESADNIGKLTPEAQASETKLSSDAQAAVDRAAEKQGASPEAQTTNEPSDTPAAELQGPSDAEKEAKAKAAAEARAARAAARAAKTAEAESDAPKEPSPNQPILDRLVTILKESVGEAAVEEAFINERDGHLPCVVIRGEHWLQAAEVLRDHDELKCNYLSNLSGVDLETRMEVVYHLISFSMKRNYCVKVRTSRDEPSVPSVTSIWATANWNEREAYDLLGIDFPGHPNMTRIMMSDEWVGHPLRKDYEPLDPEV